jgi:hypothetical protein
LLNSIKLKKIKSSVLTLSKLKNNLKKPTSCSLTPINANPIPVPSKHSIPLVLKNFKKKIKKKNKKKKITSGHISQRYVQVQND